jgi:hypothetical protein
MTKYSRRRSTRPWQFGRRDRREQQGDQRGLPDLLLVSQLAAARGIKGDMEEAEKALAEARRINPMLSVKLIETPVSGPKLIEKNPEQADAKSQEIGMRPGPSPNRSPSLTRSLGRAPASSSMSAVSQLPWSCGPSTSRHCSGRSSARVARGARHLARRDARDFPPHGKRPAMARRES